jgi:hypothetical protein
MVQCVRVVICKKSILEMDMENAALSLVAYANAKNSHGDDSCQKKIVQSIFNNLRHNMNEHTTSSNRKEQPKKKFIRGMVYWGSNDFEIEWDEASKDFVHQFQGRVKIMSD